MSAPRAATTTDAPAVAAVWQQAWHDGHRGHVPQALVDARDEAYFATRAVELVDHTVLVVDDDVLLGVVITHADEVQQLMVVPAARGRGVAVLLLDAAEQRIAADGHDAAWLAVVPGNARARSFYERRGWVDHGPETYRAATLGGATVPVTVCRYVRRLV